MNPKKQPRHETLAAFLSFGIYSLGFFLILTLWSLWQVRTMIHLPPAIIQFITVHPVFSVLLLVLLPIFFVTFFDYSSLSEPWDRYGFWLGFGMRVASALTGIFAWYRLIQVPMDGENLLVIDDQDMLLFVCLYCLPVVTLSWALRCYFLFLYHHSEGDLRRWLRTFFHRDQSNRPDRT